MDAARANARNRPGRHVTRWTNHRLLSDHDRVAIDVELDHEFGPVQRNGQPVVWTDAMWDGSVQDILMLWAQRARVARRMVNERIAAMAVLPQAAVPVTPVKPVEPRPMPGSG